jgi:hypothetical protein
MDALSNGSPESSAATPSRLAVDGSQITRVSALFRLADDAVHSPLAHPIDAGSLAVDPPSWSGGILP